ADVLGVALDELAARLDVLAHQDREQVVGLGGSLRNSMTSGSPCIAEAPSTGNGRCVCGRMIAPASKIVQ
ncbi:hypothetical protein ACWDA8_21030, partial [Streptomyces sp. NPDC001130]